MLANTIIDTYETVKERIEHYRDMNCPNGASEDIPTEERESIDKKYRQQMKPHQFSETTLVNLKKYIHHYKQRFTGEVSGSAKLKRLIQEVGTLSSNLPLHLGSSVFLRVDEDRIDVMRAMITGPDSTPYDSGCFIFDIYCPHDYPKNPPLVNLVNNNFKLLIFSKQLVEELFVLIQIFIIVGKFVCHFLGHGKEEQMRNGMKKLQLFCKLWFQYNL